MRKKVSKAFVKHQEYLGSICYANNVPSTLQMLVYLILKKLNNSPKIIQWVELCVS